MDINKLPCHIQAGLYLALVGKEKNLGIFLTQEQRRELQAKVELETSLMSEETKSDYLFVKFCESLGYIKNSLTLKSAVYQIDAACDEDALPIACEQDPETAVSVITIYETVFSWRAIIQDHLGERWFSCFPYEPSEFDAIKSFQSPVLKGSWKKVEYESDTCN